MSEEIRFITLKNNGAFNVKIRVNGGSKSYDFGSTFPVGQEKTVDLAEATKSIKEGDVVWLEAVVSWGKNNKAKQRFIYRKSSNKIAMYSIKGTTLDNTLSYNGLADKYTQITTPIRGLSLKNDGGFVARIRVHGTFGTYNVNHDICKGQERIIDLAEIFGKIKDGDEVWLETVVKAGYNKTASQRFIYRKSSSIIARYSIKGTTLNNTLAYNSLLSNYFNVISKPIRFVSLKNDGGFVARIRIHGSFGSHDISSDICISEEKRIDLTDYAKIANGNDVWLEVVVKGGTNNTARERFIYQKTSDNKACYSISGATLTNSLSYKGIYKVCTVPSISVLKDSIMNKIRDWANRNTSVWAGIEKKEIVEGLKLIVEKYYSTNKYTVHQTDYQSGGPVCTYIDQGTGFSICGPVAIMFALAKYNISTFVDVIIQLYETGSLMGYNVRSDLRNLEKDNNKIEEKYSCDDPDIANVCWMFQSSLAQKESIFGITLNSTAISLHTRFGEMKDNVNFVFNATNVKQQLLAAWSTTSKAINNLNEWEQYMKNSGMVLWEMHSDALDNIVKGTNKFYTHIDVHDLHWVVINDFKKTDKDVTIDLHSWGKLYRITVSHSEFQKMSYSALLFINK